VKVLDLNGFCILCHIPLFVQCIDLGRLRQNHHSKYAFKDQWLALLFHILEVPDFILSLEANYPDRFSVIFPGKCWNSTLQ